MGARLARLVCACAVVAALAGCAGTDAVATGGTFQFVSPGGKTRIEYPVGERQTVGDLRGPDLMDDGKTLSLKDFQGQVVVINVWGEWCPPCREEIPLLIDAHKQTTALGVSFLGVDVRDEQREVAQDFYINHAVTYPSIYDPAMRSLLQLGGVPSSAIPTTFVLDREHRVAAVFLGKVKPEEFLPAVNRIAKEPTR